MDTSPITADPSLELFILSEKSRHRDERCLPLVRSISYSTIPSRPRHSPHRSGGSRVLRVQGIIGPSSADTLAIAMIGHVVVLPGVDVPRFSVALLSPQSLNSLHFPNIALCETDQSVGGIKESRMSHFSSFLQLHPGGVGLAGVRGRNRAGTKAQSLAKGESKVPHRFGCNPPYKITPTRRS